MKNDIEMKLDPVTLSNVSGGVLEQQFQELLIEARDVFADPDQYESSKGNITCKMSLSIDLVFNEKSGSTSVYVRAKMTPPNRKAAGRGLYLQRGQWYVFDEGEQMPLFEQAKVTPMERPQS